ncbi:MAG: hypothetical protein ACRDM1_15685 [Gaiellaceae bacterium]
MSSRACPDWPDLMEIAPTLQFRHYTLREAQLPAEAFVHLGGVPFDTVSICCDLEAHVYNPAHTDPAIVAALQGTHWTNVHDGLHRGHDR